MTQRFSRPRLITADDKQYRAFVAQIMLGKQNQRPTRPPTARELFGGESEAALRDWLAQQVPLSDRRFVEYLEHRGRSATRKYRELDAVSLGDQQIIHVFEIKASQKAGSLRRAAQQLRDTRTILGMLLTRVFATILLVDTGIPDAAAVAELMASPEAPFAPPPTMDEVLATLPHIQPISTLAAQSRDPEQIGLIRFDVESIVAMVGAENLHLDWDTEEDNTEVEPETASEATQPRYSTADDDDDDNPMAAALRNALRQ